MFDNDKTDVIPKSWTVPNWDSPSYAVRRAEGTVPNLFHKRKKEWRDRAGNKHFNSVNFAVAQKHCSVIIVIQPNLRAHRLRDSGFSIEIEVGFKPDTMHIQRWKDKQGRIHEYTITYIELIAALGFFGFDPLLPLRQNQYVVPMMTRFLANGPLKELLEGSEKAKYVNTSSVRLWARKRAEDFVLLAKDYMRGSYSGVPKPELNPNTIDKRAFLKKHNPDLYKGDSGINEALYESGQLAEAVTVLDVRVNGTLGKYISEGTRKGKASYHEKEKEARRKNKATVLANKAKIKSHREKTLEEGALRVAREDFVKAGAYFLWLGAVFGEKAIASKPQVKKASYEAHPEKHFLPELGLRILYDLPKKVKPTDITEQMYEDARHNVATIGTAIKQSAEKHYRDVLAEIEVLKKTGQFTKAFDLYNRAAAIIRLMQ